jgi:hypothetical protein
VSTIYLKSTTPGKMWGVSYHKAPGRNAVFTATEGTLEKHASGFTSFSFVLFEAKSVSQSILGAATAKRKEFAYKALLAKMKEQGLLAEAA